jgi:pyruvate formate lyase activating enzyme
MEQQLKYTQPDRRAQSPVYALLKRPSLIDYPGRMCRVLFLAGCNMNCFFCHNHDLIEPRETFIEWSRLRETLLASREQWVDSVCISGGEPTLHDGLGELIARIKELGFLVKLDTNGSLPAVLAEVLPLVDYVAMDYKAPLARYEDISGCRSLDLDRITAAVKLIREEALDYEFRTTVVEGWHTEEDMHAIGRELAGAKRYRIQGYVPEQQAPPERNCPSRRTSMKTLRRMESICRRYFAEIRIHGG